MNELESSKNVEDMIYELRGVQVMLDSDLAMLYDCANGTKSINLAVKRNLEKFPEDFMFKLTIDELDVLRFQNETTNNMSRTLPYAFTEQGVAMLASVLHTDVANTVSVSIMRAFVKMKKYISNSLLNQNYINNMVLEHHNDIRLLQKSLKKINEKQKVNTIFFEGQIYDAYSLLIKVLKKAKKEIIILDNYCDENLMDILKDVDKNITIYSKYVSNTLINKYNAQYNNIRIEKNFSFHDRFIIVDKKILYHCGASFKDLGKKCFAINLIENKLLISDIIKVVENK